MDSPALNCAHFSHFFCAALLSPISPFPLATAPIPFMWLKQQLFSNDALLCMLKTDTRSEQPFPRSPSQLLPFHYCGSSNSCFPRPLRSDELSFLCSRQCIPQLLPTHCNGLSVTRFLSDSVVCSFFLNRLLSSKWPLHCGSVKCAAEPFALVPVRIVADLCDGPRFFPSSCHDFLCTLWLCFF